MTPLRFIPAMMVVAACGFHYDVLMLDPSPRAATLPDSVRVLGQEPSQTYQVLAMVAVRDWGRGSLSELSYGLRLEAARLGGNGVLIGPESVSETKDSRSLIGR